MKQSNIQELYRTGRMLAMIATGILLVEQLLSMKYKEDAMSAKLRKAGLL